MYGYVCVLSWENGWSQRFLKKSHPDSKIHGANMGPTWVLSAPGGSHVGPMSLVIRAGPHFNIKIISHVMETIYIYESTYAYAALI